jgi:hypothetical protein
MDTGQTDYVKGLKLFANGETAKGKRFLQKSAEAQSPLAMMTLADILESEVQIFITNCLSCYFLLSSSFC